jgi:hypothetical protein
VSDLDEVTYNNLLDAKINIPTAHGHQTSNFIYPIL